eukprot:TRINITY_DN38371_c0_g2_i6.p2 TRINITY_DN38371_c0_g2~~TRINITY_DN38371_c0_g2_i6.p2  ORF type:complete len:434 (-),score=51.33 TRINITY_DN38371_c0_g2_i6:148-1449(-)
MAWLSVAIVLNLGSLCAGEWPRWEKPIVVDDGPGFEDKFPTWWLTLANASNAASKVSQRELPTSPPDGDWRCRHNDPFAEADHSKVSNRRVRCRRNLPTFRPGSWGHVYYVEVPIGEDQPSRYVNTIAQQYHSAILLKTQDSRGRVTAYAFEMVPNNITLAQFPEKVDEAGPFWGTASETLVVLTKNDTQIYRRWMFDPLSKSVHFAQVHSTQALNHIMDFVHDFATDYRRRTIWQPFQVWRSATPALEEMQHNFDIMSDSFAQEMIWTVMQQEGVDLVRPMRRLWRNYIGVETSDTPEFREPNDPEVIEFYRKWLPLKFSKDPVRELLKHLEQNVLGKRPFFVYDQVRTQYAKISRAHRLHTKYRFMPLPTAFYESCSRDLGRACDWYKPCSLFGDAKCVNKRCVCKRDSACVFLSTSRGHHDGNAHKICTF